MKRTLLFVNGILLCAAGGMLTVPDSFPFVILVLTGALTIVVTGIEFLVELDQLDQPESKPKDRPL